MKTKLTATSALVTIALTLSLTACATEEGTITPASKSSTAAEETSKQAEETSAPAEQTNPKFGDTYTKNGISITISKPEAYEPSEYAAASTEGEHVVFTVELKNDSTENYDPTLFYATASSDGTEAEQIFDSAKKLDGSPTTTILPGKSVKFDIGFTVVNPQDIVMDVSYDLLEPSTLWTS